MGKKKNLEKKAYAKRIKARFKRKQNVDNFERLRELYSDSSMVVNLRRRFITCHIGLATDKGYQILSSAHSEELHSYGLRAGLRNYSAAYATGLLLARRTLVRLGMDKQFKGTIEPDGRDLAIPIVNNGQPLMQIVNNVEPLTVTLDIKHEIPTSCANVYGAMKGVIDGGIIVKHTGYYYPGFNKETMESNAQTHLDYILGRHIVDQMEALKNNRDKYMKEFKGYEAAKLNSENLESTIKRIHAAIRADPFKFIGQVQKNMCSKSVKMTVLRSLNRRNVRHLLPVGVRMRLSKISPRIHTLSVSNGNNQPIQNSVLETYNTDQLWESNNEKCRFDPMSVHFKSKTNEMDSNNHKKPLRMSQSASAGIFEQTQGDTNQCPTTEITAASNQQTRIPGEGCSNPPKSPMTLTGKGVINRLQYQGRLKKVDISQISSNLELYGVVSLKEGNCLLPVHLYLFQQVLLIGQQEPDGYITVIKEPIYCSKMCYSNIPAHSNEELILQYINEVGREQFIHIEATHIKEWLCRIQRFMVYNCNWWMTNVA